MKCKNTKKLISAMLDNELNDMEKQFLRAHIEKCKSCKGEYEFFVNLEKSIDKEKIEVPEEFRTNLWNRIDEYEMQAQKLFKKWVITPLYAAAVLLLMITGLTSKLVYAYKSNINNSSTDKALIVNYVKNCVLSFSLTPLACFEFMSENKSCIHEVCCAGGKCKYCKEKG